MKYTSHALTMSNLKKRILDLIKKIQKNKRHEIDKKLLVMQITQLSFMAQNWDTHGIILLQINLKHLTNDNMLFLYKLKSSICQKEATVIHHNLIPIFQWCLQIVTNSEPEVIEISHRVQKVPGEK